MSVKTGKLKIEDEDVFIATLAEHTKQKQFRTAWNFLEQNVDPQHVRIYDAGVLLQQLSDEVGNIGNLKDDCQLQRRLDFQASFIERLLI